MGRVSFENYAARARQQISYTEMAGRHSFQQREEANIPADVARKLELDASDDLLEIGCGTGNIVLPLARLVRTATGLDHAASLQVLRRRLTDENIVLIEGNFLQVELQPRYSKVLVYSVLQLLKDVEEAFQFLHRARQLLRPGGALLVGDIPNRDKRRRFQATERGQAFEKQWQELVAGETVAPEVAQLPRDTELPEFDDATMMRILAEARAAGFEAYLLPQPEDLPMCFSREDILIRRLAS